MSITAEINELIVVDSIPQITEQLDRLIDPVRARAAELMAMECTEENKQICKEQRTAVRKTKDELNAALKQVRLQILAPFTAVEEKASVIFGELEKADVYLNGKIGQIEDVQKSEKQERIRMYFNELRESLNIGDWLTFEDMNLKINLTSSDKSLMSVTESFLEKVSEDLNVISRLPDAAEIEVEYRSLLNLNSSVKIVESRKAQIERAKAQAAARTEAEEKAKERTETIQKAAEAQESVSAPVVSSTEEKPAEKRYRASFTVVGTKTEIMEIKKFLEERGIHYES